MIRKKTAVLWLLLLLECLVAFGQPIEASIELVKMPEGIQGNKVNCITQDSSGFMWFGSHKGLHRYDGQRFKTYKADSLNPHSLSSSYIEYILVDSRNKLWVATFGWGLNYFDPVTEKSIHYYFDENDPNSLSSNWVTSLAEDETGNVWVGTRNGLNRIDPNSGKIQRYYHDPEDPNSLSLNIIKVLYVDRQGTLWAGTGDALNPDSLRGGLNRYHPDTDQFTTYLQQPGEPNRLQNHKVRALFEDSQGRFWVGTSEWGLYWMDRETGDFQSLEGTKYEVRPSDAIPNAYGHISSILEDRQGRIWTGAVYSGLHMYDPATGQTWHYDSDSDQSLITKDNFVWQVYQSGDGAIWVTTSGVGERVLKYTTRPELFQSFPLAELVPDLNGINCVYVDEKEQTWVGTDGQGLLLMDKQGQMIRHYRSKDSDQSSIAHDRIQSIMEARDGSIWILFKELKPPQPMRIDRMDPLTGAVRHYSWEENQLIIPEAWGWPFYRSLHEDEEGLIWIASLGDGLLCLEPKTGKIERAPHLPNKDGRRLIWAMSPTSNDTYWLAGGGMPERGNFTYLALYDPKQGVLDSIPVPGNPIILDLHIGPGGVYWFSMFNNGIGCFHPKNRTIEFFNTENGKLPRNDVYDLGVDLSGLLWLSFPEYIVHFDPDSGSFYEHDPSGRKQLFEALWDNMENIHEGYRNELFVSHQNGIYRLEGPSPHQPAMSSPKVLITAIRINNELLPLPVESQQLPVWEKEELDLRHSDVIISFELGCLDFNQPDANQFEFFLEGYDLNWQHSGENSKVSYSYVPPGRYTFRARAANSAGIWSEEVTLQIHIKAPWWTSWWAYTLFLGVLLVGFLSFRMYELNRQNLKQLFEIERTRAEERQKYVDKIEQQASKLEASNRELQQKNEEILKAKDQLVVQEKLASLGQLTAGIAHEIKNPLNFVTNFAEGSDELLIELAAEIQRLKTKIPAEKYENILELLADLQQNANDIRQNGNRADRIVQSMMNHARGRKGELQWVDLNELIDENLNLAYHSFRALDASFFIQLEQQKNPDLPLVQVYPQNLGRVLLNIFNNACYAVNKKKKESSDPAYRPRLSVSTKALPKAVEIRIFDNGPGIPESIRQDIFAPFFTTKPTGKGNSGLGLSIAHEIIVQEHGGRFDLNSKEGEFTEFIIRLPL